jgi:hypothetical protein
MEEPLKCITCGIDLADKELWVCTDGNGNTEFVCEDCYDKRGNK